MEIDIDKLSCIDDKLSLKQCVEIARSAKEPYTPTPEGFNVLAEYIKEEKDIAQDKLKQREKRLAEIKKWDNCPQVILDNETYQVYRFSGKFEAYREITNWMFKVLALGDAGLNCSSCIEKVLDNLENEGCYTCKFCVFDGKGEDIKARCLLKKRDDLWEQDPDKPDDPEAEVMCGPCDAYIIDPIPVDSYVVDSHKHKEDKCYTGRCRNCSCNGREYCFTCEACRTDYLMTAMRKKYWKRAVDKFAKDIGL